MNSTTLARDNAEIVANLWRSGYRAAIMDALLGTNLVSMAYTHKLDASFMDGYNAASDRCENIKFLRDTDPLEFIRHFGRDPVQYDRANAHATVSAEVAWKERGL